MKRWIAALAVTAGVIGARAVDTYESTEYRIRKHISHIVPSLEQITAQSLEEQFERGGLGVWEDQKLVLYEIPNQATRYEEFLQRYLDGTDPAASAFMSLIYAAAAINDYNTGGSFQQNQARMINNHILVLHFLPEDAREPFLRSTKHIARSMLSTVYITDQDLEEKQYATKEVLFEWHTHYSRSPPSKQDLKISQDHIELVGSQPEFRIFLAHQGRYIEIYQKRE